MLLWILTLLARVGFGPLQKAVTASIDLCFADVHIEHIETAQDAGYFLILFLLFVPCVFVPRIFYHVLEQCLHEACFQLLVNQSWQLRIIQGRLIRVFES